MISVDPETGTWAPAGLMNAARAGHASIILRGNRGVLVIGGLNKPPAVCASGKPALLEITTRRVCSTRRR